MTEETRIFEITTSTTIMKRIERFLALLHFNSSFGHSGLFGMTLDGDGNEKVKVKNVDKRLSYEVDAIGSVGYGIEIARNESYSGRYIDRNRESKWYTGPAGNLYKDGELLKTVPSCDWNHRKNKV